MYKAVCLASVSSEYNLGLTISIYQSQYSVHAKSYIFCAAIPKSNLSMLSITSLTTLLALDIIHLSAIVKLSSTDSLVTPFIISSSMFMNTNLDAFHNLFAKFLAASTLSM